MTKAPRASETIKRTRWVMSADMSAHTIGSSKYVSSLNDCRIRIRDMISSCLPTATATDWARAKTSEITSARRRRVKGKRIASKWFVDTTSARRGGNHPCRRASTNSSAATKTTTRTDATCRWVASLSHRSSMASNSPSVRLNSRLGIRLPPLSRPATARGLRSGVQP